MSVVRKKELLYSKADENTHMYYDETLGKIILLNNPAAVFFELCGNDTLSVISDKYAERYSGSGISRTILEADALRVYSELSELGIVWEDGNNG
ncbi:MAG: hypothetical protein LBD85_01205 [Oscillospiraceae bacterium]|jgi:hypothetical protein|nr:hypothetical protein [Oscillospiraceae bacterium]